jgi:hypothetical protein
LTLFLKTIRYFAWPAVCFAPDMVFAHSRLRLTLAVSLSIASMLQAACLSPTLPLPPPDEPTVVFTERANVARLSGRNAVPGAFIVVFNENVAVPASSRVSGAQVENNGTWQCEMVFGSAGEFATLFQEVKSERSNPRSFSVTPTR